METVNYSYKGNICYKGDKYTEVLKALLGLASFYNFFKKNRDNKRLISFTGNYSVIYYFSFSSEKCNILDCTSY